MKKFYLHFQPFMQRLTPFASLDLFLSVSFFLSSRVATSLSFVFFFSPSSASSFLLPQPRFIPSTTANAPFRPRYLSSSDIRHPPMVSFSPRDVPSIRAPAGNHPVETIRPTRPSISPFVCPSSSSSSSSSFASSASFSRFCTSPLPMYRFSFKSL